MNVSLASQAVRFSSIMPALAGSGLLRSNWDGWKDRNNYAIGPNTARGSG